MEIIRVEDLNFKYTDGKQALKNINFSLGEGEMLCLCGPTGSGKSTLLRLLKREISPRGEKNGRVLISGRRQEDLTTVRLPPGSGLCSSVLICSS